MENIIKQHIYFDEYKGEYYYVALPPVLHLNIIGPSSPLPESVKFFKAVYRYANRTGPREYWYEFIGVEA